jgi:hypothetical protein
MGRVQRLEEAFEEWSKDTELGAVERWRKERHT